MTLMGSGILRYAAYSRESTDVRKVPRSVAISAPHTLVRALRTWLLIAASVGLQTVVFLGVGIVVILMTLLSEVLLATSYAVIYGWVGSILAVLIGLVFRSRILSRSGRSAVPYENATDSHGLPGNSACGLRTGTEAGVGTAFHSCARWRI